MLENRQSKSWLNPILKEIGISFAPGTLLQQTDDFELDLIQSSLSKEASFLNLPFKNEDVVALSGAVGIRTDSVVQVLNLPSFLLRTPMKYGEKPICLT